VTDSGLPPSFPDGTAPSSAGPAPRVGAGDIHAVPGGPAARASGANGAQGDREGPPDERFWADDPGPTPPRGNRVQSQIRTLIEWVAVAVGALAVALLIKAFLLQAFYIPTASMDPTLREDDRVLVNKLSYRVGDVQRGDIIVFRKPEGAPGDIEDFIKRVIGLPGETISFSDGTVFIDGRSLSEEYVQGVPTTTQQLIPGCDTTPAVADTCRIPADMVFVMGDNRQSSFDSRRFGPIDEGSIVGRAFLKVWPLGDIGFL
jgi:signal peptidase I